MTDGGERDQDSLDAWQNAGEPHDCMTCDGTGKEYGETCVTCGGFGWVNQPYDDQVPHD